MFVVGILVGAIMLSACSTHVASQASLECVAPVGLYLKPSVTDAQMSGLIKKMVDTTPGGVNFKGLGSSYQPRAIYVYTDLPLRSSERQAIKNAYERLREVSEVRFDVRPDQGAYLPGLCSPPTSSAS